MKDNNLKVNDRFLIWQKVLYIGASLAIYGGIPKAIALLWLPS